MLRPYVPQLSRKQKSAAWTIKEAKATHACTIWEAKTTCSVAIRNAETQGASQAGSLYRQNAKTIQDLEEQVIREEGRSQTDFLSACQAALHTSPVELKGMLVASYHILMGQAPMSHLFTLLQGASPAEQLSASTAPHAPAPELSPRPKRQHPSPDPADNMPPGGTTSKATSEGLPNSKQWEVPPWNKVLKQSHSEAFIQDTNLVKEARKEYIKRHSYNFTAEGTHDLSEVFRWMTKSAELLGSVIYEIQEVWMGPDKLQQANYTLRFLPKGFKFLCVVPPSESPKVMGLVGIHDPDALCCFNGLTHCCWCGKEGQNEETFVNHLWIVHYRLGLVCDKCNNCPSTLLDTLYHHGLQNCQSSGEGNPDGSVSSEWLSAGDRQNQSVLIGNLNRGVHEKWLLLGCPVGDTPVHWHGPRAELDREDATCQPTTSCHLFSHTYSPGRHPLLLNYTRCLSAVLDFISLRFKVNNNYRKIKG